MGKSYQLPRMRPRDANESAVLDLLRYSGYSAWCIDPAPNTNSQGVPDILVTDGSGRALLVEVKTAKGRLQPQQKAALDQLGACSCVVKSAEEALEEADKFFQQGDGKLK